VRGILFDFGGTLDGPGLSWTDRFTALHRRAGIDLAPERLADAVGYGTRCAYAGPALAAADLRQTVAFHVACQLRHLEIDEPRAARHIVDQFVADAEAALAESGRLLASLAGRTALGVVSNFYGNLERILADAGLLELLDAVLDSAVVGVTKPAPEIFQLALARLGVAAGDALFVGDSLDKDVLPAVASGMRAAWVAPRGRTAVLPDGAVRVRTLDEVEPLASR
jgi:putative hydrolase of the HAD superfamily